MDSYRASVPQTSDPLEFLYKLERDLELSERKTVSLIEDLAKRLDLLETRVSSISERVDHSNRQIEKDVIALADRLHSLEGHQ
ncbi:MAG: hypothetical protein ACPGRZ_16585 [Alphaproteobacteria bacterium]